MSLSTFQLTSVKCHKKLEAKEEPLPSIFCCAAATFKTGLVLNILSNRASLERPISITEAYVSSELELPPGHSSGSCSCAEESRLLQESFPFLFHMELSAEPHRSSDAHEMLLLYEEEIGEICSHSLTVPSLVPCKWRGHRKKSAPHISA